LFNPVSSLGYKWVTKTLILTLSLEILLPAGVLFLSTFKKPPRGPSRGPRPMVHLSREFGSKIAARGSGIGAWAEIVTKREMQKSINLILW